MIAAAARCLSTIAIATLLASCVFYSDYPRPLRERAFALGEGPDTTSAVFGPAARTCIALGDPHAGFEQLDPRTREALNVYGRDQYSVVIVQFDERDRITSKHHFHFRNAFVTVDIPDEPMSSAVRCLAPSDIVQITLSGERQHAGIRIPRAESAPKANP